MIFNLRTYLTTLILTLVLALPYTAKEAENKPNFDGTDGLSQNTLSGPRASFATNQEYAEFRAEEASINPELFRKLIRCESNWDEKAKGDNGNSLGLLQFKKDTFDLFAKKYNLNGLEISHPYHQMDLGALMVKDGYLFHWKNCAKKIGWN